MILEHIASVLLILSENKYLKECLKKYYNLGLLLLVKRLKYINGIGSVYLKGSVNTDDFQVGVSDLDFIVVGRGNLFSQRVSRIFLQLNNFFPFIKDFDLYDNDEFEYLLSFGGVKFIGNQNWKLIIGKEIRGSKYIYFPYKFFSDQLRELYFLLIWLNKNLEKAKRNSNYYRRSNIERTLRKIILVVKWIEKPETFTKPSLDSLDDEDNKIINSILKDQDISFKLYRFLFTKKMFDSYYSRLPFKYDWLELNYEIENTESFKRFLSESSHNFYIPKNESSSPNYQVNDIVIPESLFLLFHNLGCIDDEVLLMNAKNNKDNLVGLFSLAQAHSNGLSADEISKYNDLFERETFSRLIKEKYYFQIPKPISFLNKTTFITVNWGYEDKRFSAMINAKKKLTTQEGSFELLHLDLSFKKHTNNKFISLLGWNVISIQGSDENQKLWHKEALYNMASLFGFSSENFIFADADVYSNDINWLSKIESLLNEGYDFVHGFSSVVDTLDESYQYESWTKKFIEGEKSHVAPGLVWGIKNSTLRSIEFLPDSLPDGSCDGAFIQEMTGTEMGFVNNFKWYRSKIRDHSAVFKVTFCPVEVIHINHGVSRDYDNRGVLLDLVNFDFLEAYSKDSFGIYKWSTEDPSKKSAILLKNLYYELDPNEFIYLLDSLIEQKYLVIPSTFRFIAEDNINNELITTDGISILYQSEKPESYKIVTSSKNSIDSNVKLRYGGFDMMDNEYIHFKFDIQSQGDHFEGRIYYNWWYLFGANDLNYKFFQNRIRQTIELVASSWQDHAPMFVDLNVKKPTPGRTYRVNKINQEHVSMHHAWDGVCNFSLNIDEVEIKSNTAVINLASNINLKNGWYRVEYSFEDIVDQGLKVSVLAGSLGIPITATRKVNNCNIEFKRIIFYKNHYVSDMKLFLKFIDSKDVRFGKINIAVLSRRTLE